MSFISPFAADLIGFAGSACIIAAFAYSNVSSAMNLLVFNLVNFIGAALLTISLRSAGSVSNASSKSHAASATAASSGSPPANSTCRPTAR